MRRKLKQSLLEASPRAMEPNANGAGSLAEMPPHSGFALGLERWVARLVGAANVRETTLFPRDLNRLTP